MSNPYLAQRIPPAGVPAIPLSTRQHDSDEVDLQRAGTDVHRRTQWLATTQEVGAVALASAGIISAITETAQGPVAIAGFLWFCISAFLINSFARRATEKAAHIQEVFDCRLFYLDWNETIGSADDISRDQVLKYARKVQPGSKHAQEIEKGWYDPTDGVPYPYDVLIAQEQNLCWDVRLRNRFTWALGIAATVWTTVGMVVGLFGTSVSETLLVVFVPAAAAYDLGRERWRVQRQVERTRVRLSRIVGHALDHATTDIPLTPDERNELRLLARRIQDGIYRTRSDFGRVPRLLYNLTRDHDEADFARISEERRQQLARTPSDRHPPAPERQTASRMTTANACSEASRSLNHPTN